MRAGWCVVLLLAIGCGNVSNKTPDAKPDGAPCVNVGAACTNNPGGPCLTGKLVCNVNELACVDDVAATDGTTCGAGQCTRGECIAPVSVSTTVDLSTTHLTFGRTCAESPAYNVIAVPTATSVTLSLTPPAGCLAAGDEVLLINLQGAPGSIANVGNYEVLEVASTSDATVTFKSGVTKSYGAAASSNAGIGIGATDQKVALVRVAKFGELVIAAPGKLTTARWSGFVGGVIAVRAATITVDGSISASGLGYREGRWSQDDVCSASVTTEAGESIAGFVTPSTSNNFGGAGGIGGASNIAFTGNTPMNSGASHATVGTTGGNGQGRTIGGPGAIYGTADATTLTLGSGCSGNLTCGAGPSGGALQTARGQDAGGIIYLAVQTLTVTATGKITASGVDSARDTAASGGEIYIRGGTLSLGTSQVTAIGATGPSVTSGGVPAGHAGVGYIVVHGTVTGTTSPAATEL